MKENIHGIIKVIIIGIKKKIIATTAIITIKNMIIFLIALIGVSFIFLI